MLSVVVSSPGAILILPGLLLPSRQSPKQELVILARQPSPSSEIRQANKRAMLAAYAITGRIGKAAEIGGIDRILHYVWMHNDEGYARLFDGVARVMAADFAEEYGWERALEGWIEPVYQGGEPVGAEVFHRHTRPDRATVIP